MFAPWKVAAAVSLVAALAALALWGRQRSAPVRLTHESDLVKALQAVDGLFVRRESPSPGLDNVFFSVHILTDAEAAALTKTGRPDAAWRGVFWAGRAEGRDPRGEQWGEQWMELDGLLLYGDMAYAERVLRDAGCLP
jgi:hypothetical protein